MAVRARWGAGTMALWALVFASVVAAVPGSALAGAGQQTRHRAGPVTLRGHASAVSASRFTLATRSSGRYLVQVSSDTSVTEKGKLGRQAVRNGEDVGVHGFVAGRNIRAIYVHIYPSKAKPKGYTVKGTVQAVGAGYFVLSTGTGRIRVSVSPHTPVRLGSAAGTTRDIHVGEKVSAHVVSLDGALSATHVHIYHQKAPSSPVQVEGTVVQVSSSSLTVRQGNVSYRIAVSGAVVYRGSARASLAALHPGQSVRVYACCKGQPLVAHSIHIRKTPVHHASLLIRGVIRSVQAGSVEIVSQGRVIPVSTNGSTVFEVGSSRVGAAGIRVGDQVSIRAYRTGSTLLATRVHVLIASRRSHTIVGVVLGKSGAQVYVRARGKHYTVTPSSAASLTVDGKRGVIGDVRAGDHIRATGRLTGTSLMAGRVSVTHVPPKQQVIHGVVSGVGGGGFSLADAHGARYQVRMRAGVRPTLHGRPAPSDALFVGVHVTVHGVVVRNAVTASSVSLVVETRAVTGRVLSIRSAALTVARSIHTRVGVDVPRTARLTDGKRLASLSAIGQGAFVRVTGYRLSSGRVRASQIQVLHPALDVPGTVLSTAPELVIRTADGQRYRLALGTDTAISVQHAQIQVTRQDIAVGAHVHLQGMMRTDGRLAVRALSVRLASVTLRGRTTELGTQSLALAVGGNTEQVQLQSITVINQGSRPLAFSDLVVGDDLTVYGYRSGLGHVMARRIDVHRKLVGLDGVIAAMDAQGFTLTLSTGSSVRVRTDASTQMTGGAIAVSLGAHVTGYQRGDGIVLATKVRVEKPHR